MTTSFHGSLTHPKMAKQFLLFIHILASPHLSFGQWDDSFKLDFSYDPAAANGPGAWGSVEGLGEWSQFENGLIQQVGNQCEGRRRPSPLNLQASHNCPDAHEPLSRQISPTDCTREDMTFSITPYSLRASFPLTDDNCDRPTLTLPTRFDPYVILWMDLRARSEHVLEGRRYDAELQMVHMGTGLPDISTVSILIDASSPSDDLEFQWLLEQWQNVAERESEACTGRRTMPEADDKKSFDNTVQSSHSERDLQFSPSPCQTDRFGNGCEPDGPRRRMYPYSLWPTNWYYLYFGSLTTPPCSNIVNWRVLDEPMRISRRQYKEVTRLLALSRDDSCNSDTAISPTGENIRPLQERVENSQFVSHCTPDDFGFFVYPPEEQ